MLRDAPRAAGLGTGLVAMPQMPGGSVGLGIVSGANGAEMCNLYWMTRSRGDAPVVSAAGPGVNLPTLPGIFSRPAGADRAQRAGGAGNSPGALGHADAPLDRFRQNRADRGVTNIRRPTAPHWRGWLAVASLPRCPSPPSPNTRACRAEGGDGLVRLRREPALAFAGLWLGGWTSVRKIKEGLVTADLFAILTWQRPMPRSGRSTRRRCR